MGCNENAFLVADKLIALVVFVGKDKAEVNLALAKSGLEVKPSILCQQFLQIGGCRFDACVVVADSEAFPEHKLSVVLYD